MSLWLVQLSEVEILYHKKALCTKKKPNIPGAEGDKKANS